MVFESVIRFLGLHLCGRERLLRKLRDAIETEGLSFYPEASGRTALYRLALAWKNEGERNVAWVPDYICNVVDVAMERAGYEVRRYPTDEMLEPDMGVIREALASKAVDVLVTANVFGSSALLDELKRDDTRTLILESGARVVADLCQDIRLLAELPSGYGDRLAAVVSFNDKSFLGAMGGGIVASFDIPAPNRRATVAEAATLYRALVAKVVKCLLRPGAHDTAGRRPFEFSHCVQFPYTFEVVAATRLQLILAIIGMGNLEALGKRKRAFAQQCPGVRRTRFYQTSPYLVVDPVAENGQPPERRCKGSYAMHGKPEDSRRPDLVVIHNKGFCDA